MFDREIEDLYIAWRKAHRRVYIIHCHLLAHVNHLLPGEVLFSKIYLKHFVTGYCNTNITVFRSSMCNVSRFGNTIRDICFKNDIDLYGLHTVSIGEINIALDDGPFYGSYN